MRFFKKIQAWDWRFLDWIYTHLRSRYWNAIIINITRMGNMGVVWFSIISVLFLGKINRRAAMATFFALFFTALLGNGLIKNIVRRPRPFLQREGYDILILPPQDYSFPSGHTSSSFAAATMLCFYLPSLGIAALIVAIAIAFSRLYLCVHFLSDVLFSIFLGVGMAFLVHFCLHYFRLF